LNLYRKKNHFEQNQTHTRRFGAFLSKGSGHSACVPWLVTAFIFIVLAACSGPEDTPMDLPKTSQNEDALLRSVYVVELLQQDEQSSVDSLQSQLYAKADGDSLHPSFLLARIHEGLIQKKNQEFSASLSTLSEAYSKADSLGHDAIKLRAMPALVWLHRFNGRYELAEELAYDGLEIAKRLEDQQMELMLKAGHASTLSEIGKFNTALDILYELAEAYEELDKPYFLNTIYNSIALLFSDIGNYEESVKWHNKALNKQEELNDRYGMSRTYNNLGNTYIDSGDNTKAIEIYEKALELNKELGLKVDLIRSKYNLGNSHLELGNFDQAISYFERSMASSIAQSVGPGRMYSNMGLGRTYFRLGDLDTALLYLEEARRLGEEMNSKPVLSNTFETLYELEKQRGNFGEALAYLERFKQLSDEYNEMARNSALDELVIKHNVETTQAENEFLAETLSLQREASRNKTVSIIFLIVMVLTSIGFTYYFFRTRKKLESAYEKLNQQKESIHAKNSMLEKVSRERRAFLHIIIHDLRNPLSAISGSLEVMQLYKTKANAELVDIMDQASKRMHLLINSLLQVFERENMHLNMSQVVISDQIRSSMEEFQQHAAQKDITIKTDLPDFEAETHPDSIKTIASNLISNAVKYTPAGGAVRIKLTRSHDSWKLNVYDEGPGFTEDDKSKLFNLFGRLSARPTGGETSTGVGLYSVKMLTKRLKGSIVLDETYTSGAGFICTFPISYEQAPDPQTNGKDENKAQPLNEYQNNY
jgi:signal transduction histidine kinase